MVQYEMYFTNEYVEEILHAGKYMRMQLKKSC